MNKLGILIGIGLIVLLLIGNIKAHGSYRKSLDATVNNDGDEEVVEDRW